MTKIFSWTKYAFYTESSNFLEHIYLSSVFASDRLFCSLTILNLCSPWAKDTLKEVQVIGTFAKDMKDFWHHFIMESMEKFLVSQRSSDDRFMGGLNTEIVINNYVSYINHAHDGETLKFVQGWQRYRQILVLQTHFLFHLLQFSPIWGCEYLSISGQSLHKFQMSLCHVHHLNFLAHWTSFRVQRVTVSVAF